MALRAPEPEHSSCVYQMTSVSLITSCRQLVPPSETVFWANTGAEMQEEAVFVLCAPLV